MANVLSQRQNPEKIPSVGFTVRAVVTKNLCFAKSKPSTKKLPHSCKKQLSIAFQLKCSRIPISVVDYLALEY
ncbi:MAG: hypothetical protein AUI59_02830 [Thaumarchaeota archaeon 13_1_40CM_2_39_13_1]|nr:MAG: hypothetical protein AUI59_02830 [Thaumarchaeota archaeon 13_1_40CM_2_39_13_1]